MLYLAGIITAGFLFFVPLLEQNALGAAAETSSSQALPEPPREIPLVEKKWEELADREVGKLGTIALAMRPEKWKHAETANFIVHFRRVTEAKPVVREIEYDLWCAATVLRATPEQVARKSHVFIFQDEEEWKEFLSQTEDPPWFHSFAYGDELFLDVRQNNGTLDSHNLAHETTHAVVARVYMGHGAERWPHWLNEGFAEYMGGASQAKRTHQFAGTYQRSLTHAKFSLQDLEAMKDHYPDASDEKRITEFYQSSERFVRFLMTHCPPERFPKFVQAILDGKSMEAGVMEVYGDIFKDYDAFRKKYDQVTN